MSTISDYCGWCEDAPVVYSCSECGRNDFKSLQAENKALRAALKAAIGLARRRGNGEYPPADSDTLVELYCLVKD